MLIGMIDDDKHFIQHFKSTCFPLLQHLDESVELLTSTSLLSLQEVEGMDLLFLDIQLEKENGIDYALKIRDKLKMKTPLVFMSSKNELVFDSMATTPLYFIRKNNLEKDFQMFLKIFQKNYVSSKIIMVSQMPIQVSRIVYITAYGHDVTIQTEDKQYQFSGSMKKILQEIQEDSFVQIQKSTTIHLGKVVDVQKNQVFLSDGSRFEISRLYKKTFMERYMDYLLK